MNLLNKFKNIHLVGIKGTGMSALAVNLKHLGLKVTGSDFPETFFTDRLLKKHSLKTFSPFSSKNIPANTDLVISSTAYHSKNEELAEAARRKLPVLSYPEAIGLITKKLKSVAVCGSHGKTTTSGIIGYVLSQTKLNPIVNVGSIVPQLISYRAKNPKLFVFEADEYQNKFQYFYPQTIVLNNVDFDHPDFFRNRHHYFSVFENFIKRLPLSGLLIYCADDANNRLIAAQTSAKKISYGFSKQADGQIGEIKTNSKGTEFSLRLKNGKSIQIKSKLIGQHNALNLTAAYLCAESLKIPSKKILASLAKFSGTARRMELKKNLKINKFKCLLIDDYGHHPTEIKNTISAIKSAHPQQTLWTVFQPHTFTRTESLFDDFTHCLNDSDKNIVLDIYASKRETSGKIHSKDLVKAMAKNGLDKRVFYKSNPAQAADFLKKNIKADSVILTIGAGNVWELEKHL